MKEEAEIDQADDPVWCEEDHRHIPDGYEQDERGNERQEKGKIQRHIDQNQQDDTERQERHG
jgi:hypothetical protein